MTTITLYNPTNNISETFDVSKLNNTLDNRILYRVANGWLPVKSDYKDANYPIKIQAWANIKQAFINYCINKYKTTGFNMAPNMVSQKLPEIEQEIINKIDTIIKQIYIENGVSYGGGRIKSKRGKSIKNKSRRLRKKSRRR